MAYLLGQILRVSILRKLLHVLNRERTPVVLSPMLIITLLYPPPLALLPSIRNSLIQVAVTMENQPTMLQGPLWHPSGMTRSPRMIFGLTNLKYENLHRRILELPNRPLV